MISAIKTGRGKHYVQLTKESAGGRKSGTANRRYATIEIKGIIDTDQPFCDKTQFDPALSEVCQRACKLTIRENIEQH